MPECGKNISSVVQNRLCTGCGVCANICPSDAIAIKVLNGINVPKVDKSKCSNCSLCFQSCAGHGIDLNCRSKLLFAHDNIREDYHIGRYLNCYSGYSNTYDTRYHCASGGLLSQVLIYLLDKKLIDGAVVTGLDKPATPVTYIARKKEEVLDAKSSKYCPVSLDNVSALLKESEGKFVIVGLPCHIQSFRKLEKIDKRFASRISGYFSLFCSGARSFNALDYIFTKYNLPKEGLKTFSFRDDGCLGFLKATYENGEIIKIPYKEYYLSMRGFFTPSRCSLCTDHYGELADVCFGDIHLGEYANDTVGVNSVITRSCLFDNYLQMARSDGIITLNTISPETVNSSQTYVSRYKKGRGIKTALTIGKLLNRKVPAYDTDIRAGISLKSTIQYFVNVVFRYIGRSPSLWFIIDYIDRFGLLITGGRKR